MDKKIINLEAWLLERRYVDAKTGCWNYLGPRGGHRSNLKIDGLNLNAPQIAAMVYLNHQPDGTMRICVCHHCDNPRCFNPEHLFLGTQSDNCQDRSQKGRGRENRQDGEDNSRARINRVDVEDIIVAWKSGESQVSIAGRYEILQPQISRIVCGVEWQSVSRKEEE